MWSIIMCPEGLGNRTAQQGRETTMKLRALEGLAIILLLASGASAGTEKVLYSFQGGQDGAGPDNSLISDADGNLYGTTAVGGGGSNCGSEGCGTVFELTPHSNGAWTETVLHSFNFNDGAEPTDAALALDGAGNLYGTTTVGGANGAGTVFELEREDQGWSLITLFDFAERLGASGGVVIDGSGNLYGSMGGYTNHYGSIYELTAGSWQESSIYSFAGYKDGSFPGTLIFDKQHNLYGTTSQGGDHHLGTIFKLTYKNGSWSHSVLYSFAGGKHGSGPAYSALAIDEERDLYGTAGQQVVFEFKAASDKEDGLYSFPASECDEPEGGVILKSGNIYGVCGLGGTYQDGVAFEVLRSKKNTWTGKILYSFSGGTDGGQPDGGLLPDAAGNLYGTTSNGGIGCDGSGCGVVFEITP
jgi:uncharacterized repeat protein (TIGR03803 family)